jgi:hypothetical protein
VKLGEACVVALNGALIPSVRQELPMPRIVSAVFPFGMPAARIDTHSGEIIESFHLYQPEVRKVGGTPVSTNSFQSNENAAVSAVIYSSADAFNHPQRPGMDFVLVHNSNCTDDLSRGFIKRGREYWEEGGQLCWRDYDATTEHT